MKEGERLILKDQGNLDALAKKIIAIARRTDEDRAFVISLRGDLGSGKTTFTKAISKNLGVKDVVNSPTFVIMKRYDINFGRFKNLVHIDAYRLSGITDAKTIKLDEVFNSGENFVVIEWPERIIECLPHESVRIDFEFVDENTRHATLN